MYTPTPHCEVRLIINGQLRQIKELETLVSCPKAQAWRVQGLWWVLQHPYSAQFLCYDQAKYIDKLKDMYSAASGLPASRLN